MLRCARFHRFPNVDQLLRTIRVRELDFLFLCIEALPRVADLAAHIDDFMPGLPVITLGRHLELDVLPKLMHLDRRVRWIGTDSNRGLRVRRLA